MRDGGDRLHDWMFDAKPETDVAIVEELYAHLVPLLLSDGIRLFDDLGPRPIELRRRARPRSRRRPTSD